MATNRDLTDLTNIGTKIATRLEEAGIRNEADLRKAGAVEAHQRIKANHPGETLPVCYYLYAFEGALRDTHWNDIGEAKKKKLRAAIEK